MNKQLVVGIIYALVMIGVIVGVDLAFLRDHPIPRLIVNVCIVLLFGIVYLTVIRKRF